MSRETLKRWIRHLEPRRDSEAIAVYSIFAFLGLAYVALAIVRQSPVLALCLPGFLLLAHLILCLDRFLTERRQHPAPRLPEISSARARSRAPAFSESVVVTRNSGRLRRHWRHLRGWLRAPYSLVYACCGILAAGIAALAFYSASLLLALIGLGFMLGVHCAVTLHRSSIARKKEQAEKRRQQRDRMISELLPALLLHAAGPYEDMWADGLPVVAEHLAGDYPNYRFADWHASLSRHGDIAVIADALAPVLDFHERASIYVYACFIALWGGLYGASDPLADPCLDVIARAFRIPPDIAQSLFDHATNEYSESAFKAHSNSAAPISRSQAPQPPKGAVTREEAELCRLWSIQASR